MIGQRFGSFQVQSLLGAGGMGEVYRAHDSRLGRAVALKVLPAHLTDDSGRLARFEREARALASLSHPHIGAIYGLEEWTTEAGSRCALVLELVEGETLAEWIASAEKAGTIGTRRSVDAAVAFARQLAEALDAAHERGVIHRDLKPSNIKVTPDGVLKVLDFGLAKAIESSDADGRSDASSIDAANSPTMAAMTQDGQILGTPAYMSPEQARGRAADKRTDIWSYGCVVYEMLTGRAPFRGDTLSDTIAAVLDREPDWTALPAPTPESLRGLLHRCLEKDPKRRLRDIGDVDFAVIALTSSTAERPTQTRSRRHWLAPGLVGAMAGVMATLVVTWLIVRNASREPPTLEATQFEIAPTVDLAESGQFSVSPDGRHVVFAGTGADGVLRLWLRSFDSLETKPLFGTEADVLPIIPPMFWSPDSRTIGFYTSGKVRKVDRGGGVPQAICDVPGAAIGGTWNRDGVIVVGNTAGGLLKCPAAGGTFSPVTRLEAGETDTDHLVPWFLPDGRHFIYLRVSRTDSSNNGLFLGDLTAAPDAQPASRIVETGYGGAYVATGPQRGHILFVRDRALMALPFDEKTLAPAGEPTRVIAPVGAFLDTAFFTASPTALVVRGAAPDYQLTWVNRGGTTTGVAGAPADYVNLELSPDGTRLIAGRENRLNRADRDLWMIDLSRNTTSRFTSDPQLEAAAAWSRDGVRIYFAVAARNGQIKVRPADGSRAADTAIDEKAVGLPLNVQAATISVTPDDRNLVAAVEGDNRRFDLWLVPLDADRKATPLFEQPFDQIDGRISSDWRWLAYVSNETSVNEIFVRSVSRDAGTNRVSVGPAVIVSGSGGSMPRWRRDGKELFYFTRSGAVTSVSMGDKVGSPVELFRPSTDFNDWDVSPDGQRFLIATPTQRNSQTLTVVLNWQNELNRVP